MTVKNGVVKGTGYVVIHTPGLVKSCGATQTSEVIVNPQSEYLKAIDSKLRSYDEALSYYPHQSYIGNFEPEKLREVKEPWCHEKMPGAKRFGDFGEIMPQEEFYLLLQAVDEFDLVLLEQDFVQAHLAKFKEHSLLPDNLKAKIKAGFSLDQIEVELAKGAVPLYSQGELVACVKAAHAIDPNLNSHVLMENLSSKASAVLALLYALKNSKLAASEIDYVVECSEEACGDIYQRGGGNFAKAIAESCGLSGATGSDLRAFCAAPAHALIEAAALVKSGAYKHVAVVAGGSTAKLGMNGREHLKKDLPILEDSLASFAVIVSENDGENPEINLDYIGRHTVGTGSAPQAVISSIVTEPLARAGLTVLDVDKFCPELQNPDITKPAGSGDVPMANYKMIAALAVKSGQLARSEINQFIEARGMPGYAATQGHIPSGVPYLGYARKNILAGDQKRVMVIGKGSLFLGRITNLFDGVSFLVEANQGESTEDIASSKAAIKQLIAKSFRDFASSLIEQD